MVSSKAFFSAFIFVGLLAFSRGDAVADAMKLLQENIKVIVRCIKENHISAELFNKVKDSIKNDEPLPDDKNVKCYAACHLLGLNVMTKDGIVDFDKVAKLMAVQLIDPKQGQIVKVATDHCKKTVPNGKSDDICESTFEKINCFYGKAKQLNIKVLLPGS